MDRNEERRQQAGQAPDPPAAGLPSPAGPLPSPAGLLPPAAGPLPPAAPAWLAWPPPRAWLQAPERVACPVCGQPLPAPGPCPNRWCRRRDRAFSVVFSVGAHEGALRHAIGRYKYRREMWWAGEFARQIAGYLHDHATWFEEFDLLVPAPSYSGPLARRDWDPLGEICVRLRDLLGLEWEMAFGALVKTAETPPMQGRSWTERQHIARGPLRESLLVAHPPAVAGSRVLVIDDVMTEGSTLREMARVLRAAGANEVAGLVLARLLWSHG